MEGILCSIALLAQSSGLPGRIIDSTAGRGDNTYVAVIVVLAVMTSLVFILRSQNSFLKDERTHREKIINSHSESLRSLSAACHENQQKLSEQYEESSKLVADALKENTNAHIRTLAALDRHERRTG